jgi:DNA-binding Lrp family transcriptional regulator
MSALDDLDLDLAILAALEGNARIAVSELARRLETPSSTIRDRIRGLEESGVILGYTALVDPAKLGLGIKAIIQVTRDQTFPWKSSTWNRRPFARSPTCSSSPARPTS